MTDEIISEIESHEPDRDGFCDTLRESFRDQIAAAAAKIIRDARLLENSIHCGGYSDIEAAQKMLDSSRSELVSLCERLIHRHGIVNPASPKDNTSCETTSPE